MEARERRINDTAAAFLILVTAGVLFLSKFGPFWRSYLPLCSIPRMRLGYFCADDVLARWDDQADIPQKLSVQLYNSRYSMVMMSLLAGFGGKVRCHAAQNFDATTVSFLLRAICLIFAERSVANHSKWMSRGDAGARREVHSYKSGAVVFC